MHSLYNILWYKFLLVNTLLKLKYADLNTHIHTHLYDSLNLYLYTQRKYNLIFLDLT